ncbi:MAG: ribosomal RNA small subunit methyltransferase A [Candidatus Sungbacteria bacterium]|nr:ribosomal RNA small subunit methyltransferase A [Candidatus Sungbacteria bacterium]
MHPKKSLGQHFLGCSWVVSTLIKTANVSSKDIVLEIGPGTGILTNELAKCAGHVIAVEKDERLAEALKQQLDRNKTKNIEIIIGDVLSLLKSDFNISKSDFNSYKVVANIPYYLTSRLIRLLLEAKMRPNMIVLTIQKEVAKRLAAKPPHINLLALSVQAFGNPKIIKTVPAGCFYPKPKVDSAIISISDISDEFFQKNNLRPERFFEIARFGFSQKRKKLLSVLGKKFGKQKIAGAFSAANISPDSRPQELSLGQWAEVAQGLRS